MESENKNIGRIYGIYGNVVAVEFEGRVVQNEVAYIAADEKRLKAEVVRVRGERAELQVFEDTRGLAVGNAVEFTGELLSVELGPGLLGNLYDGLQNPLHSLAEEFGFFLSRGRSIPSLPRDRKWRFIPSLSAGDKVEGGDTIGTTREGIFDHRIMVPFHMTGECDVVEIAGKGEYGVKERIATLRDGRGKEVPLTMSFSWPVKRPIAAYRERLAPAEPLITRIRIIDTLFPVGKGGTYCIPGPFGSGKTVLQQITSRNAMVDIVIIAACGERAGEIVETIREFPKIADPFSGRSLMERTIIVCNTSSMPVAARESSVYTAVTMAEYYRQMGFDVLLLADSTSRWAQAMRERSGRLEEIPGEEAFPAYLETVIAGFYERAGVVRLKDGNTGSVTIGGTISPAGGSFEEPVTQATLKVVGAFHGLSTERSDARRYPAIGPLESWSKYGGVIDHESRKWIIGFLRRANEIGQMMRVVGEEGTSLDDYLLYLKGELFDSVYLQQNAYDEVDAATPEERQRLVFSLIHEILTTPLKLKEKGEARDFFNSLRLAFLDLNGMVWDSDEFKVKVREIGEILLDHTEEMPREDLNHLRLAFIETEVDSIFWRSERLRLRRLSTTGRDIREEEEGEEGIQQDR